MYKTRLLLVLLCLTALSASSQTLFTYGKYSVSAAEFLKAFNKNNTQTSTDKAKAMQDYLELYINSRLKIREAYERGYDTLPQISNEVQNLRNQIIEGYMTDPESMKRLQKEAFTRSQKDIHVGHIFFPITDKDTLKAYKLAQDAMDRVKKGTDFLSVAQQVSLDPTVKSNKGDLGWITVFTLPYHLENIIYNIAPGKTSTIVRSRTGYHIFKNLGERKAMGKMKARQILLSYPAGSDEATKNQAAKLADSLYKRIMAGEDFAKLATNFSNDYMTSVTGGSMPDFGIGQYDPTFESKVWALTKDGAVTKPFQTSHGYHIVKRVSIVPVVTDPNDKNNEADLKQKINQDQRWKASREIIFEKVARLGNLKKEKISIDALRLYTDSIIDRRPFGSQGAINNATLLFQLGDTSLKAADWITYAQAHRYRLDGSGQKPTDELLDEYIHAVAFQYYRDHLEDFNDEFRYQMNEFRDGNLFFEIMQQEIWNRASNDSAELVSLYETNKQKYNWSKSADAVIFFCADADVAKKLYDQMKKNPANWKSYSYALGEKVVVDSARFEWEQIPNKNKMVPVNGLVTTPIVNATDNTTSFAYIIKTYPQPSPRAFIEAKGLVINDYQYVLEQQWIQKLRAKYPVKVNTEVFKTISK